MVAHGRMLTHEYTVRQKNIRAVAVFRCKMAFLNWAVEADPGGVQKRTVSHFKDLE